MKEIIIIIRPNFYFKTKEALAAERYYAMSTKEVLGRGKTPVIFRAAEGNDTGSESVYENVFVAKKMIMMVVPDKDADTVVSIVLRVNSHGMEGDGKIFVLPVEGNIRIHTGEKGEDALI